MTHGALRVSAIALGAAALVSLSPLSAASAATVVHHPAHAVHRPGRACLWPRRARARPSLRMAQRASLRLWLWLQPRRGRRRRSDRRRPWRAAAGYPYDCGGYYSGSTGRTYGSCSGYYGSAATRTTATAMDGLRVTMAATVEATATVTACRGGGAQFAGGNFGHMGGFGGSHFGGFGGGHFGGGFGGGGHFGGGHSAGAHMH